VVGILTTRAGFSFWAAFPLAGLLAGIAGVLLAVPALRVRGPYLAMVTIAFGFIVEQGAAELGWLTGGWNGIIGIPREPAGRAFAERNRYPRPRLTLVAFWLMPACRRPGGRHARSS
jgi:ABC-type branched-subunit amino acid transport system permease subunit